jgi:hypothetical protein
MISAPNTIHPLSNADLYVRQRTKAVIVGFRPDGEAIWGRQDFILFREGNGTREIPLLPEDMNATAAQHVAALGSARAKEG